MNAEDGKKKFFEVVNKLGDAFGKAVEDFAQFMLEGQVPPTPVQKNPPAEKPVTEKPAAEKPPVVKPPVVKPPAVKPPAVKPPAPPANPTGITKEPPKKPGSGRRFKL